MLQRNRYNRAGPHPRDYPLALHSALMRSVSSLAPVAWVRYTARSTHGCTARWRSRSCQPTSPPTLKAASVSTAKPRQSRR